MKIISLIFLTLFTTLSYSGWYQDQCEYIRYRDVPIATRIPDNRLPTGMRQQVWRDPNIKSGECLRHNDEGLCRISGINNSAIFNSKGYSYSQWTAITTDPFEATHCIYCYDLNQGKPNSQTVNAYLKLWVGYKYTCKDSQGVYGENYDGCYNVTWEKQEYVEIEPCMQYRCYETDEGDQHGIYSCQVQCPEFNNTSVYNHTMGGYICRESPPELPEKEKCETKDGVFDCFADDVVSKLEENNEKQNSILQNLSDGFKHLIDYFDFTKSDDSDDSDNSNVDPSVLNADVPISEIPLSIKNYSLFKSSVHCPADNVINLMSASITFSYSKLCNALSLISNVVMLLAFYFSYKLLRGA